MGRLFEDDCEFGLYRMPFHHFGNLCEDMEKLCTIQLSNTAPCGPPNLSAKSTYRITSIRKAPIMQETASAMRVIVDSLKKEVEMESEQTSPWWK